MRILVIAAHPDDETLGCGGTIAKFVDEGHLVQIKLLSEGRTAEIFDCTKQAIKVLGADLLPRSSFPDNMFDSVPLLKIIERIESTLRSFPPDVVFTHHIGDLNIDHSLTAKATLTALRPGCFPSVKKVFAYEVPSSTEWSAYQIEPCFRPNVYVKLISPFSSHKPNFIRKKIEAFSKYTSEIKLFPHPRSDNGILARAQYWGTVFGTRKAEAFQLIREELVLSHRQGEPNEP